MVVNLYYEFVSAVTEVSRVLRLSYGSGIMLFNSS